MALRLGCSVHPKKNRKLHAALDERPLVPDVGRLPHDERVELRLDLSELAQAVLTVAAVSSRPHLAVSSCPLALLLRAHVGILVVVAFALAVLMNLVQQVLGGGRRRGYGGYGGFGRRGMYY